MSNQQDNSQQKIFTASLKLFAQKGYGSTTIRDIASSAGISVGLLFHYYPSKQALLKAHLELAAKGLDSATTLLTSAKSPISIFTSLAEMTLRGMHEPTPRYLYMLMNQPLASGLVDDPLMKKVKKIPIITASVPVIREGQQCGEIKQGDPHALALAFWGAIQGVAMTLATHPDTPTPHPDWLVDILRA